jgi:hypothetical protein
MVDLRSAPPDILERYFGKPEAAAFVQWHRERAGGDQNGARTRM